MLALLLGTILGYYVGVNYQVANQAQDAQGYFFGLKKRSVSSTEFSGAVDPRGNGAVWDKLTETERLDSAMKDYATYKAKYPDLSSGPCIADTVYYDWVVDIVHNPRTAVDDLAANQCASYNSGLRTHYVELDLDGKLVRTK